MYLDHAATTKIHPEVKKVMEKVSFANYNAQYYEGAKDIKKQIDNATMSIANNLGINENEIVYTSGATESNNYIIKGIITKYPKGHFITSTIEHKSVLETFKYLETLGYDISYVSPNNKGQITLKNLKEVIKNNTKFVSIMYVNNETGVINEIEEISTFLHTKKILFHSDIVQAMGKLKINFNLFDYVTISGHKIAAPKGIGLAIIRSNDIPISLLHGSNQQNGHRAGTLTNELIIGLSCAIDLIYKNFDNNKKVLEQNKNWMLNFLDENLGNSYVVNFQESIVSSILSVRIKGQIGQIFLLENSDIIEASTGSSCSINEPSYVLKECNFSDEEIQETIRLSFSPYEKLF